MSRHDNHMFFFFFPRKWFVDFLQNVTLNQPADRDAERRLTGLKMEAGRLEAGVLKES